MDAFEQIVASICERNGWWARTSVKVELTSEQKVAIGRPSSPRWELDVVAYSGQTNALRVIECKSYLDSAGVSYKDLQPGARYATRYKLFTESALRDMVLGNLRDQLVGEGFCAVDPSVTLGLAAGRIQGDREALRQHMASNDWFLWEPEYIAEELHKISSGGYENSIAAVVTKLLTLAGESK